MNSIALQPLVADQVYMPQMKAMYVPFDMVYGGLMCCQRLQSDRPINMLKGVGRVQQDLTVQVSKQINRVWM